MNNNSTSVSISDNTVSITISIDQKVAKAIDSKYGSTFFSNKLISVLNQANNGIRKLLDEFNIKDIEENLDSVECTTERPPLPPAPQPQIESDDFFRIRKRIPNEEEVKSSKKKLGKNVIDVSELNVVKAKTNNVLVRCPKCGQAHCCIATTDGKTYFFLERDFDSNEFKLIGDAMNENEIDTVLRKNKDKLDYFNDLQSFLSSAKENDILLSENSALLCPCCEMSFAFIDWIETYKNPLNEFETEHLCDACGGEMVEVRGRRTAGQKGAHTFTCEVCKRTIEENENE